MPADRKITWKLDAEGAQSTASEMGMVSKQMEVMDAKSRVAASRFTGVASASSAMGTALMKVNPAVGGMASALGTAGGATSGLMTAIGGVGGLAAGGLVAALSMAIQYFMSSKDAAEDQRKELDKNTEATDNLTKAVAKLRQERSVAAREEALRKGTAEEEVFTAKMNTLREKRSKIEKEIHKTTLEALKVGPKARAQIGMYVDIPTLHENIAAVEKIKTEEQRLSDARQSAADAAEREKYVTAALNAEFNNELRLTNALLAAKAAKGAAGVAGAERMWEAGFAAEAKATNQLIAETEEKARTLNELMVGSERDELMQGIHDEADARMSMYNQISDREREYINQKMANMEAFLQRMKSDAGQIGQAWFHAASVGPGAMANALYDLAKGHEVSAAKVIEGIGDTLWSSGWAHVLQAAAYAFIPGLQGPAAGLATAGAAEMAGGLVLGAAGARAGGAAGGGAGGAARPSREHDPRERGGGDTIVVNIQPLPGDSRTGQEVIKALQTVQRKRGKAWTVAS